MTAQFYERLSNDLTQLLENPIDYNVTIEVGEGSDKQIYKVHSYILQSRNSYFQKKLNEISFNENHIKVFKMSNISIKIFNIIIKYIYGGIFSLEKLENSVIFDLLITSNELNLDELVEHLQTHFVNNNASWLRLNFSWVYQTSYQMKNFNIIQDFCNNIIAKYPNTIFESKNFLTLPEDALISIIKQDDLQLEESQIWQYIIQWGKAQNPTLPVNLKEWTSNNFLTLKTTLKQCLSHIRYFSISGEDVFEMIFPYQQILEPELWLDINSKFLAPNKPISSTVLPPRKVLNATLPTRTTDEHTFSNSDINQQESKQESEQASNEFDTEPEPTPTFIPNGSSSYGDWIETRVRYIPLRLNSDERKRLRLLEAALNVSEYTEKIDILPSGSSVPKVNRIVYQIKNLCGILSSLLLASDYNKDQELFKNKSFEDNEEFFQTIFEIGRRNKITNPEKMRDAYGKLMYLLMDSIIPEVKDLLQLDLIIPIKTVYDFLKKRDALRILHHELIPDAVQEIIPDGKRRQQINQEIRKKEKAIKLISYQFSNHNISSEEIKQCLYSIGDNHAYLRSNRDCCIKMLKNLTSYFNPSKIENGYSLAIRSGKDGARLSHNHETQYHYANQTMSLWREIQNEMFKLWFLADEDLLSEHNPYRLKDTGQGLNRMQRCPSVSHVMHSILHRAQKSAGYWIGSSIENGYSLAIRSGKDGARLSHNHETQYHYANQTMSLWREIQNEMFKLWFLADEDLLSEHNPYRLKDTGQGLNRMQRCPSVSHVMHSILHRAQKSAGYWIGSSVIHLGNGNVPNALMFIDKYNQVSRILNPILICLEGIKPLTDSNTRIRHYINDKFGSVEELKKGICADFFRYAFDGSGTENLFDAGSCIDGRLTSAWNWYSQIGKKEYFPVFFLTEFVGFDGEGF
ncbi:hypothetical protein Glove_74g192 [Diversispora epigaea]|uniref:BTB domain-containing protein n=1 Tax=Diversispora epigaea TaxID=1348612 RepID=A0A397JDJ7_9GLOM|nr:hypothetical protein Glove_74g192 [Diversispora epigaea]